MIINSNLAYKELLRNKMRSLLAISAFYSTAFLGFGQKGYKVTDERVGYF